MKSKEAVMALTQMWVRRAAILLQLGSLKDRRDALIELSFMVFIKPEFFISS